MNTQTNSEALPLTNCSASLSAQEAVAKIPSDQLHEAYAWTCEYLNHLKHRMAEESLTPNDKP